MKEKKHVWPCRLMGVTTLQDGSIRRVDRSFDGAGDVVAEARKELARRADHGAPWYGDAVTVITLLGQRANVEIPWPGEEQHDAEVTWVPLELS